VIRRVPRMDDSESQAWLGLVAVLELLPSALDAQLQRDSGLTHFEFTVLTLLQFAPEHTLRMKRLAAGTNATLPRLSHVVSRLENRGLVERFPCPDDRRATNARLTDDGRRAVIRATPEHIALVRHLVIDALEPAQVDQLAAITGRLIDRLDPDGAMDGMLREAAPASEG
jgi:DNA-binding MarR family transcriptional regulator